MRTHEESEASPDSKSSFEALSPAASALFLNDLLDMTGCGPAGKKQSQRGSGQEISRAQRQENGLKTLINWNRPSS